MKLLRCRTGCLTPEGRRVDNSWRSASFGSRCERRLKITANFVMCAWKIKEDIERGPLQPMQLNLKQPSVSIAMEIATLPWSSGCHRFMLSIIDYFPNSSRSSPCMTVESVRDALVVGWIYWHGLPRVLLTDHGRNVDGQVTQKLCSDYGIV